MVYNKREEKYKLHKNESRAEFMKRCVKIESNKFDYKEACDYCNSRYGSLIKDYSNELIDKFIYDSF